MEDDQKKALKEFVAEQVAKGEEKVASYALVVFALPFWGIFACCSIYLIRWNP